VSTNEIPFHLPENLVLMAGAGAGKTHALVTLALHLLSGAREGADPLPAPRLCMLTFTEKAASEMKARLRRRVAVLADGAEVARVEPELALTFEKLGQQPPDLPFFMRLLEEVPLAFVGTFHSFCAQLLRRYPGPAGVTPDFELLEEATATARLERAVESVMFESLEAGDARADGARRVVRALGFAGEGEARGAREHLMRMYHKLAEEGREAPALLADLPELDEVNKRIAQALQAVMHAIELVQPFKSQSALDAAFSGMRAVEQAAATNRLNAELVDEAIGRIKLTVGPRPAKEPQRAVRDAMIALRDHLAEAQEVPLTQAFISLLSEVQQRFAAMKKRDGVLDFADLLNFTRALLRDHSSVRAETQARVGALLIDEFQDTNPLQLELVSLLAEKRDYAPRPLLRTARCFEELPLEPRFLVAVGDRKQSIYEFRGAEVSLLTALADRLQKEGVGRVAYLQNNWRSRPPLLGLYNKLFPRAMRGDDEAKSTSDASAASAPPKLAKPFQVRYDPAGDDLVARREVPGDKPCAELIVVDRESKDESADSLRWREACALADRLVALLRDDSEPAVWDREQNELRRARGGDVAILLRRYTYLETFRRALITRSIPFVVVQGRGFFGAQEVRDLAHLLRTLDEPEDAIAWAAVLRSPWVGLTDASLLRLAQASKEAALTNLADPNWTMPKGLEPFEAHALERYLPVYRQLVRDADRLKPSGCLELALEALDLRAVLAAGFQGEQQVANVDKLVGWVRNREAQGATSPGLLARELLDLAETDPKEGQAAALEEGDPRAVRIMTVHQSKGLEFPLVCVPECGAGMPLERDRVLYERTLGLCVKPRDLRGHGVPTPRSSAIGTQLTARIAAESLRLFYVALTRARDYLILSGETRKGPATWRTHLDTFVEAEADAKKLLAVRHSKEIPSGARLAPSPRPAPTDVERAEAREAVLRAIRPAPLSSRRWALPLPQLADAVICPRRYHLAHEIRLSEDPPHPPRGPVGRFAPPRPGRDSAARGTLAHALLSRADWGAVRSGDAKSLNVVLAQEGQAATVAAQQIVADVKSFIEGPLAARLLQCKPDQVHRELPVVLTLPVDGQMVAFEGQLDLLALLDPKNALLLNFQLARAEARPTEAEALRLGCLAVAARELLGPGVELTSGVVYLRDRTGQAVSQRPPDAEPLKARLVELARSLQTSRQARTWSGLEAASCKAAGCGYLYRCHANRLATR
jgi:ATP-dependent exoDNAse (exonuclease V) beta subunit